MIKLLLTPEEAAHALGIGRSKLYELMQAGELESVRIGACRRVTADALAGFVQKLNSDGWVNGAPRRSTGSPFGSPSHGKA